MTIARLRISAPQSPYRVCDIAVLETDPTTPTRVICTDADTELIVEAPQLRRAAALVNEVSTEVK